MRRLVPRGKTSVLQGLTRGTMNGPTTTASHKNISPDKKQEGMALNAFIFYSVAFLPSITDSKAWEVVAMSPVIRTLVWTKEETLRKTSTVMKFDAAVK